MMGESRRAWVDRRERGGYEGRPDDGRGLGEKTSYRSHDASEK